MNPVRESLVYVRRGEELLVLLRCEADGGYWHSVAGGVEPGETFEQAAARELREEVGLDATPEWLGRPYDYDGVQVDAFVVTVPEGWEPTLNEEHVDYRWCTRDEAVLLLEWPEVKELARTL